MDNQSWPSHNDPAIEQPTTMSDKKPRHRHSPSQLESLNELFARAEHPSLDERTALAQRLGMCVAQYHGMAIIYTADCFIIGRPKPSMHGFKTRELLQRRKIRVLDQTHLT